MLRLDLDSLVVLTGSLKVNILDDSEHIIGINDLVNWALDSRAALSTEMSFLIASR